MIAVLGWIAGWKLAGSAPVSGSRRRSELSVWSIQSPSSPRAKYSASPAAVDIDTYRSAFPVRRVQAQRAARVDRPHRAVGREHGRGHEGPPVRGAQRDPPADGVRRRVDPPQPRRRGVGRPELLADGRHEEDRPAPDRDARDDPPVRRVDPDDVAGDVVGDPQRAERGHELDGLGVMSSSPTTTGPAGGGSSPRSASAPATTATTSTAAARRRRAPARTDASGSPARRGECRGAPRARRPRGAAAGAGSRSPPSSA